MRAHEFMGEEFLELLNGDVLDPNSVVGGWFWQEFDAVLAKIKGAAGDAHLITTPAEPLVVAEARPARHPTQLPADICDLADPSLVPSAYVKADPNDEDGDGVVLTIDPATAHPNWLLRKCRAADRLR